MIWLYHALDCVESANECEEGTQRQTGRKLGDFISSAKPISQLQVDDPVQ